MSKKFTICQEAKQVNTKQNLHFECLEPHHFVPEIVETYPYEQLSHAVLNWVEENADRCDVIHGHEWGGAFVDLITANNYRQVRRECTSQSMLAVFRDGCLSHTRHVLCEVGPGANNGPGSNQNQCLIYCLEGGLHVGRRRDHQGLLLLCC